MGCQASRAGASGASGPKLRRHRGAPPMKLWIRGAGEAAANGTFYRVHPKKARNPKMPACLVVYANKRGYTLTNCNLNKETPTFSTTAWTLGRGEYKSKPWKGLFVSLYRRPYRFDKEQAGKSCRPPVQGWVKTIHAHDHEKAGGLPAIAYDKRADKYLRTLTFRINHGLQSAPPGMRGIHASRAVLPEAVAPPSVHLREEGVSYPGESSSSDSDSDSSGGDSSGGDSESDAESTEADGGDSHNQFESNRPVVGGANRNPKS